MHYRNVALALLALQIRIARAVGHGVGIVRKWAFALRRLVGEVGRLATLLQDRRPVCCVGGRLDHGYAVAQATILAFAAAARPDD